MALQMIVGILLLKCCNRNAFSFLYVALGINFLYFLAGAFIIPKLPNPASGPVCVWILGIFAFVLFLAGLSCVIQKTELDKLCAFITGFFPRNRRKHAVCHFEKIE